MDAQEDFNKILYAILDSCATNYTKLQHPLNRCKSYHLEDFANSIELFFNPEFTFEHLRNPPDFETRMTGYDFFSYLGYTTKVDYNIIQSAVVNASIDYWWEKKFHKMPILKVFTVCGYVWTSHESKQLTIDYDSRRLYIPKQNDKMFYDAVLKIIKHYHPIDIKEEDFESFSKYIYLFLKINNAFSDTTN